MADFDKPSGYPIKALSKAVKETQKRKPVTNNDDADAGGDPKDGSKTNKVIQKVDPKKYVEINPKLDIDKINMNEARSQSKIDYLIRLGLGDMDRLTYYRQVMSNPQKANQTPYLRKYVAETLDLVLDIVFEDAQIYNRVRTKLQDNLPQGGVRSKITKIEDALIVKAYKSGIDLDIIKEVYQRGLLEGNEETGFNRVNSFIAGGKARKLDADLLDSPGGVGSDAVTKKYADMTPGQSFELIKKALKGNKND